MKRVTTVFLTIFLVTLAGCGEVTGELQYLDDLKRSISEKYDTEEVEVNINTQTELEVLLKDSKFSDLSEVRKEEISKEIGGLAKKLRHDRNQITKGIVKFRDEENYGILKTSRTEGFQMYN